MKKNKFILLVLSLIFVLSACSKSVDTSKFENIDKDVSFYMDSNKKIIKPSEVGKRKVLNYYFDPACYYCLVFETEFNKVYSEVVSENAVIKYHPISFLGRERAGANFTYSDIMTSNLIAMVEKEPEKVFDFLNTVMTEKFLERASKETDFNEFFKKVYEEDLHGKKWDEIQSVRKQAQDLVIKQTELVKNSKELKKLDPQGKIYTPFVYVEGEDKNINVESIKDYKQFFSNLLK